jgi:sigma-B regulation protein RsbU (phosphoserine phosphatase)
MLPLAMDTPRRSPSEVPPGDPALLVVDDDEDNRGILVRRLARQGYTRATTARDGREALELLRAQPFDLVLLDIMMPEVDGYEVLARLRADRRLRHIPVIMISALDEIESVIRCIELGAEDYLPKPFNPTLLRARVGATLEKKRLRDEVVAHLDRIEKELNAARDIQLSMVPHEFPLASPSAPVDLFAVLEPARQIGGDLYDFFWSDAQTLCFVVADVSDKGAPAALFMARTKTLIRAVTTPVEESATLPEPHHIVARLNEELCRDNAHAMFVTLFLGMLTVPGGELRCCNAGHHAPYLVGTGGALARLDCATGKPVGIAPWFRYESSVTKLAPGEGLFMFTDGVTEAMDADGHFFSDARLEASLRAAAASDPRALIDSVMAAVRTFAAGAPQSDDIAALALRLAYSAP